MNVVEILSSIKEQKEKIEISEDFRADGLERILYRCPNCQSENTITGKGIHITCSACGKAWELDKFGFIKALQGDTEFSHIPDWYEWEREQVKQQIEKGEYSFEDEVDAKTYLRKVLAEYVEIWNYDMVPISDKNSLINLLLK